MSSIEEDIMERSPQILDPTFNAAVLNIAATLTGGFSVSETAPATYEELVIQIEQLHRIVVWSGASDATIFGDPEVNYAFRAWHDWCHWHGRLPFTFEGEQRVCEMHCAQLLSLYGDSDKTRRWCRIVEAEIIGQRLHFDRFGHFPSDQYDFVVAYLNGQVLPDY